MPQDRKHFVKPNDPILIKRAKSVSRKELQTKNIQNLIEKMLDIAFGKRDRKKAILVGLAAPQVGISRRIILVDIAADGEGKTGDMRVYINPSITFKSKKESQWYEGCWSTGNVAGIVLRPDKIKIKALDRNGNRVEEVHTGYTARIFQHEIDHLNGNEFVTHIKNFDDLHWVNDDQWVEYRNREAWRNWLQKCSREKWEKIKGIQK